MRLCAEAEHEGGWSSVQDVWVDLRRDLRELDRDLCVDIDFAATAQIGWAAIFMSDGKKPQTRRDPDSVALLEVRADPDSPLRLNRRFLRVYVCRRESLAVFESISHGVEIVDLSHLDKWLLRFYVSAATSGDLPPDKVTLDIDNVRVSELRGESGVVGRLIDSVTNRGVADVDLEIGSEKQTASTNADGYYFVKTASGPAIVNVRSAAYEQISEASVQIKQDSLARLDIVVRRTYTRYGDVETAIPFSNDYIDGLAVDGDWLYISAPEDGSACLYRIHRDGHPQIRVASLPAACSLAMMNARLLGLAWWPGRIYDINPGRETTEVLRLSMAWPRGMAFDGKRFWVVEMQETGKHGVHALNADSWEAEVYVAARERLTGGIAVAPDGRVWVATESAGVYELDANLVTQRIAPEFPATTRFSGDYAQLAFADGSLWGVDNHAKRVCKICVRKAAARDERRY